MAAQPDLLVELVLETGARLERLLQQLAELRILLAVGAGSRQACRTQSSEEQDGTQNCMGPWSKGDGADREGPGRLVP